MNASDQNFKRSVFGTLVLLTLTFAAHAQLDTLPRTFTTVHHERYIGYTVSFGTQNYQLMSNIPQLNKRNMSREGASVGFLLGNHKGMWRTMVGLYYSSPSFPYSIDVVELGVSKSFYLLHFRSARHHTIEPYAILSSKVLRSSFFGNCVDNANAVRGADEKLVGRVSSYQSLAGIGAEYQLANEQLNFIHFFAEFRIGTTVYNTSHDQAFKTTRTVQPVSFSLGISLGNIQ
jgi:hypothetical protein